ncbi:F0F1 ATP synthase subunit gamma [Rheinheimera sediminis]|uniref:F0F1 ATP synthase subunit gamma n=1 Tax=Rheinheimera sp. YQF-1 TaxID=2499626 RepID=UPI000FD7CE47|nr:F0F1 ATP synthase subunit gamma [Rheinheimera sp. YQF-1]RVT44902.1 F0F1 ATP synthase subunit gamma [Rheinheimera sp. YQF-1]
MSETLSSLQRKIGSAQDLQAVVRTMKAMAGASIGQYEKSVLSLNQYYLSLELALHTCLRLQPNTALATTAAFATLYNEPPAKGGAIAVVVFGSDQGLVGQFNETMTDFVTTELGKWSGVTQLWTIGERIQARLADTELSIAQHFALPGTLAAITPLVTELLLRLETAYERGEICEVVLFHHQPQSQALYSPRQQRLLPLDDSWRNHIALLQWPTNNLPQVIGNTEQSLLAFVHEYLFVALFRACAESLASENASRLLAMQRAEKNIEELLDEMQRHFHLLRQSSIDEELFDLFAGFTS